MYNTYLKLHHSIAYTCICIYMYVDVYTLCTVHAYPVKILETFDDSKYGDDVKFIEFFGNLSDGWEILETVSTQFFCDTHGNMNMVPCNSWVTYNTLPVNEHLHYTNSKIESPQFLQFVCKIELAQNTRRKGVRVYLAYYGPKSGKYSVSYEASKDFVQFLLVVYTCI